ncbi:MAG: type II/IV secretion system protein [Flavobacteriales bacterium]|nr:type II/IV secretion system protein [Flavobacteriales bacterium]
MEQLDYISLNVDKQNVITTNQAWNYGIIPKNVSDNEIGFYIDEAQLSDALHAELEILFGKTVSLESSPTEIIKKTLSKYYRKSKKEGVQKIELDASKAKDLLSNLVAEAKNIDSSDIHIEAYEERCRVRMRIDGLLVERYTIKKADYPALINKVKIKANLDISEKRLPQDGRIFFTDGGQKLDIRVSVLPTLHGEKVVLRLLNSDAAEIDIEQLGFELDDLKTYLDAVKRPNGIVLISGPTGSGKTTTLYATLKILNQEKTNILTVEDPIEYTLEGINQVQLKESIGLTFASALKSFLRQDPDVIMLGEIRDGETAQMAVRAALTGHLVLSTIHTNSAWGTISRLADMGVPPFLIASTLNTSVAQRLVRLLCKACKKAETFDSQMYPRSYKPTETVTQHMVAVGCDECYYTGYKGRKAIYEVIPIDFELANAIKEERFAPPKETENGPIKFLGANAFDLFKSGSTSIEEVYPLLLNSGE